MIIKVFDHFKVLPSNTLKAINGAHREFEKLENWLFSGVVSVSKELNELSAIIIMVDSLNFDVNLDEFSGLI